jgi:PPR repeat family
MGAGKVTLSADDCPFVVACPSRNAWNKSGSRYALERSEIILKRMEELCANGRPELRPSTVSYNTVLDCLSQSKDRDSAVKAERLLEYMDEQSNRDDDLWHDSCRPDEFSFNTVLNCWARSRDPMAAQRAEAILEHMERRFLDGSASFQPDVMSYNTVLTVWARSKNHDKSSSTMGVDKATQLLQRMEKAFQDRTNRLAKPNSVSYNIVMNALAHSSDPTAVDQAFVVFNKMVELGKQGNQSCRPDRITYTTLIHALSNQSSNPQKAAKRAIELLKELEDSFQQTKDPAVKPNTRAYTSVRGI